MGTGSEDRREFGMTDVTVSSWGKSCGETQRYALDRFTRLCHTKVANGSWPFLQYQSGHRPGYRGSGRLSEASRTAPHKASKRSSATESIAGVSVRRISWDSFFGTVAWFLLGSSGSACQRNDRTISDSCEIA